MADAEPERPKEDRRREKINRRLMVFGILVVLFSFVVFVLEYRVTDLN